MDVNGEEDRFTSDQLGQHRRMLPYRGKEQKFNTHDESNLEKSCLEKAGNSKIDLIG